MFPAPTRPNLDDVVGKGSVFGPAFTAAANAAVELAGSGGTQFESEIARLFRLLQTHGCEFGYRTALEACRFIYFYKVTLGTDPLPNWFAKAFDAVILQKVIPKLHGSRAKLAPLLQDLWQFCVLTEQERKQTPSTDGADVYQSTAGSVEPAPTVPATSLYPSSAAKIGRMWKTLRENGFVSFADN